MRVNCCGKIFNIMCINNFGVHPSGFYKRFVVCSDDYFPSLNFKSNDFSIEYCIYRDCVGDRDFDRYIGETATLLESR